MKNKAYCRNEKCSERNFKNEIEEYFKRPVKPLFNK